MAIGMDKSGTLLLGYSRETEIQRLQPLAKRCFALSFLYADI
jgi:hypothetical protein